MRVALAALALAAAVPAAAGERRVEGNGEIETEVREVSRFEGIRLETSADVTVRVGPPRAVRVTVDRNLQPLLTTKVEDGVLVVDVEERIRPKERARVEIDTPTLRRFSLDGHGSVRIEGGDGDLALAIDGSGDLRWRGEAAALTAAIEGAGDMTLAGRASRLTVRIDGSGDVEARGLAARDVVAAVEGSGDVDVTVEGGTLTAAVSGSGGITWRGTATVQGAVVSGSGEITRRE